MSADQLPLSVRDGSAVADFTADVPAERYDALLAQACELAFADPAVRRLEVLVAAPDWPRRRALHRAGFRLDGVLRARLAGNPDPIDECHYSLLRGDSVEGREAFTAVMNTVTARKRVIAHLLLTDADGRVCALETTFKPDYELPGGILEPGESPREGLVREAVEELDFPLAVGRLLVVDWLAPYLGWEDAVELVFDGGVFTEADALHADGREIRAVHWLEPAAAEAVMAPYAQGRLRAALSARAAGQTLYLEAGQLIS
ncbi:NUDIX hydrolase [Propionicimonas sp.]|uniref:NUDIX hydrolase n=1 Tax=Propionicimonas sp. TaxID=1955623 RepID=UPI001814FAD7|nr:NUDIX hydrolase [Propionicimonas sp.]MBU3977444.1 NUDIX hydrolase [Actinomycetota bacterium]MBA3021368.1 NUDIX hydrolase [Propionicimonas sp.]MBU3985954.1 NUDIX hydrolase [Actinomycetota bacterium]MBU4008739.1 NUDIX hydrolase [Actinomycetota bacterium]MBU4066111.1 NUDIX hydrolase [Actinomycetota bacterium]